MKTHIIRRHVSAAALFAILLLIAFVATLNVSAAEVPSRDRGSTGRTTTAPPAPTPAPAPTPVPPPHSGGITSVTDGSVNSGGNTGGNVTTGDQHVDVHEINIGPTNPPPPPPPVVTPPPAPAPECDLRTRTGCATQDQGRTR